MRATLPVAVSPAGLARCNTAPVPALRLVLLGLAVVGVLLRPKRLPVATIPVALVLVALATTATTPSAARHALHQLYAPLAFLLLAVPLAVMLDRLGFFNAVAARIDHTRHLHLGLWLFAAAVTTLFNLDASVVLLTPLYVRIARRHGLDPVTLAFPPVLLAMLGSGALPVSNLTNLLAAERFDVGAVDFLTRLGPASIAAILVGYAAYRHALPNQPATSPTAEPVDERALVRGIPVVVFVLLGFTLGDAFGVPAWAVALVADVALIGMVRAWPWRTVPVDAALLAAALGVLAAAAAPHLGLHHLLAESGSRAATDVKVFAIAAAGANLVNNLPALLVAMPALGPAPGHRLWALLLGVNLGPILVISGSLAGLLWLDMARRLGVAVDARTFSRIGIRVGLPAMAAALAVLLLTNALHAM
jgi:arsenical pump membrane protein